MFNLGMLYHFGSDTETFSEITGHSGVSDPSNIISIDLNQAQKFYQKALREEGKAQAPVYLLYLYSKWQSIDLYQSIFKDLLVDQIFKSPKNQLGILASIVLYITMLWATVRYLRKDIIERQRAH